MENHRKRRAVDELDAAVKVSRSSETRDDDEQRDASAAKSDADLSSQTGNSNGDAAVDRKRSPLTCAQCDLSADQPAGLLRHVRTRSSTSSPDPNDDEVDVETEDVQSTPTADEHRHRRDLFCVDCRIQFTSPGTYRAHRSLYCARRGKRDAPGADEAETVDRRRRRVSDGGGTGVGDQSHAWSDDLRPTADTRPALFPPSLAALSSSARLMEMLSAAGAPPPPPPGAFFLAPFLAAAAAAAAAGASANGLTGGSAAVQLSPPTACRPLQPPSAGRRSSTSVSDDEPLDLTTCRNAVADSKISKHERASPTAATASPASALNFPRQFADPLDPVSLFLPPSARLPLSASIPLPVVRQPLSSPPSISHCAECNIVFYKHANYLAHKTHYCAGRHSAATSASGVGSQDQPGPGSGPAGKSSTVLKSDDVARGGTALDDGRRRSPEPHELVATLDDSGTTIQFYCIPCKIKFSSLDTLRAHKQFYCPARIEALHGGSSGELATPTRHRHASRVYGEDGERQAGEPASDGGTCTACGTRITSSRSSHRCPAAVSLYQCPHCDYAAQSDSRLVEHVRAHAPSRAFRCALCGYRGNTVRGMRMHGKMHNDEAGRGGNGAHLPTFTDDCVIEYEEPPAIPPRRLATGGGGAATARRGVDTELLRQKNEPYKRRRSRKAYEKAEYAPTTATTPVVCAECAAPLIDSTHAQAHASAHAAERLLAWEALCGSAAVTSTPTSAAVAVCKADVDVDRRQTASPVTRDTPVKSAAQSLLATVKVEQSESDEQNATTDSVDDDGDRKCNGTEELSVDDHKSAAEAPDERTSSTSPSDDVDVTGCSSARPDADVDEDDVSGRRSPPPLTDVTAAAGRPGRPPPAAPRPAAGTRRPSSLDVASRYCEQCDITFMYASTFIAHKKYYCSSHAAERADATARATATATTGVAV